MADTTGLENKDDIVLLYLSLSLSLSSQYCGCAFEFIQDARIVEIWFDVQTRNGVRLAAGSDSLYKYQDRSRLACSIDGPKQAV